MADGLIRRQRTEDGRQRVGASTPRLLISVFCLLSSALCCAEELPDPTRPPALIAGTGAAPGAVPGQGAAESRPSGLQSTIISESRRAAIIDGKTVELGAKHGNAQLIEVNEGSVVLRGEQTRRVLTLFPDVKINQREIKKVSPESGVQPETQKANQMVHEEKK